MTANPTTREAHWQNVYQTKADRETSWYQDEPAISLQLIRECVPAAPGSRIVDIGGGSSVLAGRLAEQGYDVTVLDVSAAAIERARARIGPGSERIHWIVADVTRRESLGRALLWHDRAVFHFLTDAAERKRYVSLAERTVQPGGSLVIGTFAIDGPEMCSGLPVERYDEARLLEAFGAGFTPVKSLRDTHTTPWGKPQPFFFAVLRRSA